MFEDATVLVDGGAGSLGSEIVRRLLQQPVHAVRILDNNEYTLFNLQRELGATQKIRCLVGDIRDYERVKDAVQGCDIVIHAAALKNLELTEDNPQECISVNIHGTQNLLRASRYAKIKKFCNLSSDKCVNPSTLYGTTKLIAEKVTTWHGKTTDLKAFNVRLGNIRESRGNVFELWHTQREWGDKISLTDPAMRRYFMSVGDAAEFVLECIDQAEGAETFIPKMKKYNMTDLALTFAEKRENIKIVGVRGDEKLDEELMTETEKKNALNRGDYWVLPNQPVPGRCPCCGGYDCQLCTNKPCHCGDLPE